eukprot:TRINITY_DN193_c1_g1_i3.p2 TRINITY_DN193_c1_g1~~TRINITY_DN193_c1_g1_i3.p2  ORF type:complete len:290 (+),score=87.96 TRINITY_DN193_c1_g1_i3:803-1672(+)
MMSISREILEYLSSGVTTKSSAEEDSEEEEEEEEDGTKQVLQRTLKSLEVEIKQELSRIPTPTQLLGVISTLQRLSREHKLGLKKADVAALNNATSFTKRAITKDGKMVLGLAFSVRSIERKMEVLKENRKNLMRIPASVWGLNYDDSQPNQDVELNEEEEDEFVIDKSGDQKMRGNLQQNISMLVPSQSVSVDDDDSEEELITDFHARNLAALNDLDDKKKKWIRDIVNESDGEDRDDVGEDEEAASDNYSAVMKDINKAMQNNLNTRKIKDSTMTIGQDLSDSEEDQ